jgi:hypothetical protein
MFHSVGALLGAGIAWLLFAYHDSCESVPIPGTTVSTERCENILGFETIDLEYALTVGAILGLVVGAIVRHGLEEEL